jgi:PAS domain-containing protein
MVRSTPLLNLLLPCVSYQPNITYLGVNKMKDQNKRKKQLIDELMELRQRIAGWEALENERKRTEDALGESENKFQQLFDEAPVGYHEYDTQGRITRVKIQDSIFFFLFQDLITIFPS